MTVSGPMRLAGVSKRSKGKLGVAEDEEDSAWTARLQGNSSPLQYLSQRGLNLI